MFTGSSAGGIATFIWADKFVEFMQNPKIKIYAVPDSGIFFDVLHSKTGVNILK